MALTHGTQILRDTARAAFWTSYANYPSIMAGISQEVQSSSDQETYAWLAYAPAVREMQGGRSKRSVPELTWTVKNKKWENTVAIDYETWKYAKVGTVQAMLSNLGAKARAYPDKLMSRMLDLGHTTVCYDGQYMFDTDHTDPSAAYTTSQVNYFTANVTDHTAPTDLEMATAVRTMQGALRGFKDGDGDPVYTGTDNFVLMVAPDYAPAAMRVEKNDQLTGPIGNDLKGTFRTVINPFLPTANNVAGGNGHAYAYLFNVGGMRKAMIYQVAEAVSLEDDIGGDNQFATKDVCFGSFGFYNCTYGDWRFACQYDFT